MSVFGKIWSKISGHAAAAPSGATGSAGATSGSASGPPIPYATVPSAGPAPTSTTATPVDVEAIMMDLEAKSEHKSNWRVSIVDLMSLLGMDNSLAERKELAKELGYRGDMNDSAKMNMWLHKQVMQQMAANGGKVPANMLD